MTEMTPRQILDAIDRALARAAHEANARPRQRVASPRQAAQPAKPTAQMTPRELLDAMDRALKTAARLASTR
jgi:hypothetical protein